MLIDGRKIRDRIVKKLKIEREGLEEIKLGVILVGSNKESLKFINQKKKIAQALKIDFVLKQFPEDISRRKLREEINFLKEKVEGIIIQLPLPTKFKTQYFLNAVTEELDVDVLSERALGKFYTGRLAISPPSVIAFEQTLKEYNIKIDGKVVVIVGLGDLVGRPIATYLARLKKATLILCDENTKNLKKYSKMADILITGVGKKIIKKDMVKRGAVLLDFGGDVETKNVEKVAKLVSPTKGGMGPIVASAVFKNLIKLVKTRKIWAQNKNEMQRITENKEK